MCDCNNNLLLMATSPDTQTQTTVGSATTDKAAPYIPAPWKLTRYDDSEKDDFLKRYTLIFQSLAALFSIMLAVYAFTRKSK